MSKANTPFVEQRFSSEALRPAGRRGYAQPPRTSKDKISPASHSATTSNGRQHTSQSVTKLCDGTLVSTASSKVWPQNGHCTSPDSNIGLGYG